MMKRQIMPTVDIFKFICAVLVIGIHTEPFSFNRYLDLGFGVVSRIAVPFFFIASAYFLFNGEVSFSRMVRYCKRIIVLYLLYSSIYVCVDVVINGSAISDELIKVIWGYRHLWYLYSSVFAVLIIFFLAEYLNKEKIMYCIAAIVQFVALCAFTYQPLFNAMPFFSDLESYLYSMHIHETSILYSIPYMTIGFYFSKHDTIDRKLARIGAVISLIMLIIEGYFCIFILHTDSTIVWISVVPLSACIFALVTQIKIPVINTGAYRKLSTAMYCIHPLFIDFLVKQGCYAGPTQFIVVVVLSIMYSLVIYILSKKDGFSVLGYLM